jgi:hypothetical protein
MIERGKRARFPSEPRQPPRITGKFSGQYFHRYVAAEFAVVCSINFAHPARAQQRKDSV